MQSHKGMFAYPCFYLFSVEIYAYILVVNHVLLVFPSYFRSYIHLLINMSSSRGCPLQLLNKDDNVEVDDIDAYLHFEDEDHDLSTIIIYLEVEQDVHPIGRLSPILCIVKVSNFSCMRLPNYVNL